LRQIGAAIGSQKLTSSSTLKGPNCHSPDRLTAGQHGVIARAILLGVPIPWPTRSPAARPLSSPSHAAIALRCEVGRLQLPVNVDIMHRAENLLPDDLDDGNDRPADLGWIVLYRQVQAKVLDCLLGAHTMIAPKPDFILPTNNCRFDHGAIPL
jgi:hypothetical protein